VEAAEVGEDDALATIAKDPARSASPSEHPEAPGSPDLHAVGLDADGEAAVERGEFHGADDGDVLAVGGGEVSADGVQGNADGVSLVTVEVLGGAAGPVTGFCVAVQQADMGGAHLQGVDHAVGIAETA